MANPYEEWNSLLQDELGTSDPYSDWKGILEDEIGEDSPFYDEYPNIFQQQKEAITPTKEEQEELLPRATPGFKGALVEGFKSGLTLGYASEEFPEDMTTGELSGMLIGEMAGGLGPLLGFSAVTGGFGAPVAVASKMKRAYDIVKIIGRTKNKLRVAEKAKDASKIVKYKKDINKYTSTLNKYKKDYIKEVSDSKLFSSKRKIKQLSSSPLYPTASGILGRNKKYQNAIQFVATKTKLGFQGANALNRFAQTSAAFAGTGFLRKRGEGDFGELKMAERVKGIPKDVYMGALFSVAGLPTMLGVKGAGLLETSALMGLGTHSDYLTGNPSDMSVEERLMHGLTLVGFHHLQQGLGNRAIKEKMFNGLREMGFSEPEAFTMAFENKNMDAQLKRMRDGETFRYRNLKNKDDWSVVAVESAGKKNEKASIVLRNIQTGKFKTFEGSTLTKAREKLHKEYERFDYKDPKLKDDVVRRNDMDFQNRREDQIIGEAIPKVIKKKDKTNANPDWVRFNHKKQNLLKKLTDDNYTPWEKIALITTLYPKSKTRSISKSIDKLTYKELSRLERFVNKKESKVIYDSNLVTLVPEGMSRYASEAGNKLWNVARELGLSTSAYFEPLGSVGKKISRKLEQFSMWRADVMGSVVLFEKKMNKELKKHGFTLADINKHVQIMRDNKYEKQRNSKSHKEFLEKIRAIEKIPGTKTTDPLTLEGWINQKYDVFFDDMAKMLISSNSWVRTIKKDGSISSKRFVQMYGKNKKPIELVDMYENPVLHTMQVDSFLNFLKNKDVKKVLNNKGDEVNASRKLTISNYKKGYSPRMVTERFMEISELSNRDSKRAIKDLMERPEIKELDVSMTKKEEIARQMFNDIINMKDSQGVYGGQWSRIADLPSHYYLSKREGALSWDRKNMRIVKPNNVVKANGEIYRKGDKIYDKATGKDVIIEEVVPVYETNYNKVLESYSNSVSHASAAAHVYGSSKHDKIMWTDLVNGIKEETGNKTYANFAEKVLRNQLFGENRTLFDTIFRPIAKYSALTGLSSPMSSVKNVLLGNVQNATVFSTRALMKNSRMLWSRKLWKSERELALDSGFTHIGSYDLFLKQGSFKGASWLRKIVENAGGMQTTEAINRTFSGPLGEFSLRESINVLSSIKTPATKGLKVADARRMMIDVFKFTPKEINDMIARAELANKAGESMVYKPTELQRARYRAQLVTQGSGDIAYVPYWMSKQWAKPLTLFYRVAYRVTDTVANNVIKPIVADGNMIPAMKYVSSTIGSGMAIHSIYEWILDEDRMNKYKSMPNNMLDYFIKAEGLGLFSNAFDEYGGVVDSYQPVVFKNAQTFVNMMVGMTEELLRGEPEFAIKEVKDGASEIVAAYNFYKRTWQAMTGDTEKQFMDSRRRQSQFLDAFYPKEKLDIDYDDGTTSKTAYYRAIKDTFWIDDNKQTAKSYYAALHYLTHTIMAENGYSPERARKEARSRLKRTLTRMRPIPASWRKKPGRTGKSKYFEYYSRLPEGAKEQENNLDSLYLTKKQELFEAIDKYKKLYDTELY